MFRIELKQPTPALYDNLLVALYYLEKNKRNSIVNKVSEETKERFRILGKIIEKKFSKIDDE